jgi:hypothetical protein
MAILDETQQRGLSTFLTGYAKRWMEGRYDDLMRSQAARPLLELGSGARYGVEAGLYLLLAFIDAKWKASTPFQMFLKEVIKDAPPEIGKRLVNGFREQVVNGEFGPEDSKMLPMQQALLDLDNDSLRGFLKWYAESNDVDRAKVLEAISTIPPERLAEPGFAPGIPSALASTVAPKPGKPAKPLAASIVADLNQARARLGLPPRESAS